MGMSGLSNVCALGNRNYELWQPLMALASWLKDLGASDPLTVVQAHAAYITGEVLVMNGGWW